MNTNIVELDTRLPRWIHADPEVVRREKTDLYEAYLEAWEQHGQPANRHVLQRGASIYERKRIARHNLERMADEVLKEAGRAIQNKISIDKAPREKHCWFGEFDCTVGHLPYWLVRGIGYRMRPAVELLTLLGSDTAIREEFDSWLPHFIARAEYAQEAHLALGRRITRTQDFGELMVPLVSDIRDGLQGIVSLANQDKRLAGVFPQFDDYIDMAFSRE